MRSLSAHLAGLAGRAVLGALWGLLSICLAGRWLAMIARRAITRHLRATAAAVASRTIQPPCRLAVTVPPPRPRQRTFQL